MHLQKITNIFTVIFFRALFANLTGMYYIVHTCRHPRAHQGLQKFRREQPPLQNGFLFWVNFLVCCLMTSQLCLAQYMHSNNGLAASFSLEPGLRLMVCLWGGFSSLWTIFIPVESLDSLGHTRLWNSMMPLSAFFKV